MLDVARYGVRVSIVSTSKCAGVTGIPGAPNAKADGLTRHANGIYAVCRGKQKNLISPPAGAERYVLARGGY